MSGVEAPTEAAPSPPPPLSPHPAHHTDHDDDEVLPVTTTTTSAGAVVSSSTESVPQVVVRSRRKLENEDSSYDSDFEPCECTPASPRPEDEDTHEDVYRTVSDTLGAEFAEYVTLKHGNPMLTASPSSVITRTDTTSPSCVTTHVIKATKVALVSTASSPPAVSSTASNTQALNTTHTVTTSVITPATNITTSTPVNVITTVTTTTSTVTVPTTCVTSSSGSKSLQESSVRATSPAVRLPSSSPSAPSSSSGPPALSVTPPAPVTATPPHAVIVTQAVPAFSIPCSSTTSSTSSSTTTPAVTIKSQVASSPSSVATAASSSSTEVLSDVSWVVQHAGYAAQVEFGVKLGYSEALVQQALVKLGGTPDKDELLAELIRLGTSSGRPDGEGDAADDLADLKENAEQHHQQLQQQQQLPTPKPIIIDGSNVAMRHGNKTVFSCRGLRICVDWFRTRGHNEITVFVPAWRKEAPRWDTPITDQEILLDLEQENVLVFTPSRVCGGKRIVSYDDRYILNEAVESGGVVVSNDNYRDLAAESQSFRKIIEESLLMYSWVNGRFVPPDDPLGRNGPTLDAFLRKTPKDRQAPCPYRRKCTYGNKCKYMHPERGTAPLKSVTERLQEKAQRHYQKKANSRDSSPGEGLRGKSLSLPVGVADTDVAKKPLQRTQSNVPSVSLTLPSALTQETPTHDLSKSNTTCTASHTHRHLMPPQLESHPLDPLRSSQMFKSESSLYHLYLSQGPQASYGASNWGWESPATMPNPQSGAPHSQPQNYGAHMPLSKNLSDPDSVASDNPHKKLQRQLTLNPAYDSRLYKIVGFKEPAPERFSVHQQQSQQQAVGQVSPSRTVKRDNENLVYSQVTGGMTGRVSPGYSPQYDSREQQPTGLHSPLTRHSSSQESAKHMTSLPGHLYPPYNHPHVTRFASAPDPIWGGQQQQATSGPPHITRLNSTSDTRLNLYGCGNEQFISEIYDNQMSRLPPFHSAAATHHSASPVPAAPSPGPIGSRPMSPQQPPVLHRSSGISPRQHLPSQQAASFPNPHEDARLTVYYHLSNLFPEAQVRAALAMYPEETDPHKICTSIFSMCPGPGPVGSRPMSPHQATQSAASHQAQGVGVRGSSSPLNTGFSNPLPPASSSHEDARFRAFYNLSQLFPVAQVRAVLARYPEETDAQTLCATLIGFSGNQS